MFIHLLLLFGIPQLILFIGYYIWRHTRSFWIYLDSTDPDQITKYYKLNLRNNKKVKVSRDEYYLNVNNNFNAESKHREWK